MRIWIDKGYFIESRELEDARGHQYYLPLAYQVFDEAGAPSAINYRGEGTIRNNQIVIGDPYRDTRLMEGSIANQPTSESWDYYQGFRTALSDRREAREGASKQHYAQPARWWEGYRDGWREKRENAAKPAAHEPNARRWRPAPDATYLTLGVLAGAYRGKARRGDDDATMLTHLAECDETGLTRTEWAACRRQRTDHLGDAYGMDAETGSARPTCEVCAERYDVVIAERGVAVHRAQVRCVYERDDLIPNAGRAPSPPPGFVEEPESSHYSRRDLEVPGRNDYEKVTWKWLKEKFGRAKVYGDDVDSHFKAHRLFIRVRPALGSAWQDHLFQEFTPDGLNDAKRYGAELLRDGLADAIWFEGMLEKYYHGHRGRSGREARAVVDIARWERAEQTPNGSSYYVWVIQGAEPIAGPFGPYALGSAKDFARIGAKNGDNDRAVSCGRDPQAARFEFVRRYAAGSGERVR